MAEVVVVNKVKVQNLITSLSNVHAEYFGANERESHNLLRTYISLLLLSKYYCMQILLLCTVHTPYFYFEF